HCPARPGRHPGRRGRRRHVPGVGGLRLRHGPDHQRGWRHPAGLSDMSRSGLSPEIFEALRGLDGPTLSNAIETFNVRDRLAGYAGHRVRCLFPDLAVTLGYAVTAQVDRTSPSPPANKAPLGQLARLVEASPKPVVLVFQDIGPRPGYAASFGVF